MYHLRYRIEWENICCLFMRFYNSITQCNNARRLISRLFASVACKWALIINVLWWENHDWCWNKVNIVMGHAHTICSWFSGAFRPSKLHVFKRYIICVHSLNCNCNRSIVLWFLSISHWFSWKYGLRWGQRWLI